MVRKKKKNYVADEVTDNCININDLPNSMDKSIPPIKVRYFSFWPSVIPEILKELEFYPDIRVNDGRVVTIKAMGVRDHKIILSWLDRENAEYYTFRLKSERELQIVPSKGFVQFYGRRNLTGMKRKS